MKEPKTIADIFAGFKQITLPDNLSDEQYQSIKTMFYSGAISALALIINRDEHQDTDELAQALSKEIVGALPIKTKETGH